MLFFVKNISARDHSPEAKKLPTPHGKFVEERYHDPGVNGIKQSSVSEVKLLIASTA